MIKAKKLYAARWKDGTVTWLEAYSLSQARLLHIRQQKEYPLCIWEDIQWDFH